MKNTSLHIQEYGRVTHVHHPLTRASGLPSVQTGNIVQFENGALGQVISYDKDIAEIMAFDKTPHKIGSEVTPYSEFLEFPVSDQLLGKCVSPLGEVIYGKKDKLEGKDAIYTKIETSPPPLSQRAPISHQLITGVGVVDLLLPLAEGQRELIAGDQKTGRTSFLYQTITTQVEHGTIVIWAHIGKKTSELLQLQEHIATHNLQKHVITIATTPSDPSSLIYLTPFTAMTIAEYFRDQGHNVLVVLDDLTIHAKFYREISLLAKHFPGRDSYPGDIFYTHGRLLERAGTFTHPHNPTKKVSISCLPVADTDESDLTSYIVSNLISITDGHLLFDHGLFSQGLRPAIHTSLSVTRVGRQTQSPLYRQASQEIHSMLASYQKTRSLTHFGSELAQSSKQLLSRGENLLQAFVQPLHQTLSPESMVVLAGIIWLGWWDEYTPAQIHAAKQHFVSACQTTATQEKLQPLLQSPTWKNFLNLLPKYQSTIEKLCQA